MLLNNLLTILKSNRLLFPIGLVGTNGLNILGNASSLKQAVADCQVAIENPKFGHERSETTSSSNRSCLLPLT
jgi:hypothetical protein